MVHADSLLIDQVTYQVLGYWAMRLVLKIHSFFGQNVTWTEFDWTLKGNHFFFFPLNNATISEYLFVKVSVAAVRLLVSNHI